MSSRCLSHLPAHARSGEAQRGSRTTAGGGVEVAEPRVDASAFPLGKAAAAGAALGRVHVSGDPQGTLVA